MLGAAPVGVWLRASLTMIRAMPAITIAAAMKIAISSALVSPPLLVVVVVGVGTVTGPVWVVVGVVVVLGIGVVGSVVSGAVLVALAGAAIAPASKNAPSSSVAIRARPPFRPNRGARGIVAI
jgi:hypothetical protein